ncbi:pirin family protein [Tepidicaulis sp. LMO-SS28]|uniref:pirin family protein n=1 Tax=Tepidicaulis sp. LMO-SS28 TaxID=3447455 RepID=UPI003EDEC30D
MKKILGIHDAPRPHWVGDGFPVRSLFSYQDPKAADFSPFLLFDYAGPAEFKPASRPRGVGTHPHRGFETVTLVYQGEVSHKDSTGKGGTIGPGDVQWMTAGGGILHEEFHSEAFTAEGGTFQVVQLWVNLPAKDKMTAPGYQAITKADIPQVALPDGAGSLRVIAGEYAGTKGPAKSFTPMNVWDVRLGRAARARFDLPEGWTTLLAVLDGTVEVNGEAVARSAQLVELGRDGSSLEIEANGDAKLLLLSGQPINEPIAGYGPFVMNSEAEIRQAVTDFNEGRFGQMSA